MTDERQEPTRLPTSLGPTLELQVGGVWSIDLEELPLIHGLSVLSRALAEMIVVQAKSDRIDVSVERRLRPRENPELIDILGVTLVKVTSELEAIAEIADHPATFEHHLRALLGNLQRRRYREALIPPDPAMPSRALLADFSRARAESADHRFLMEFVPSSRGERRGFLRITIESPRGRRLDLSSVPHLEIEDVEDRTFIAGSTRIAQTWTDLMKREAERGRRSLVERKSSHGHLFSQLELAGLGGLERVAIQWDDGVVPLILEGDPEVLHRLLKRVLLALEDVNVRRLLARRAVVRVDAQGDSVFLDVSHLGRVLNLSLGQRRQRTDIDGYLERMPALAGVVRRGPEAPLAGVRVFLVHHVTAEVLGLIAALRRLGCRDLTCLFVAYGGEPPSSYLDALLDVPVDQFRALALVNVPAEDSVEGHYRLSTQYSALEEEPAIAAAVALHRTRFLDAMRAAGMAALLAQLHRAREAGERLLLIEDGGYLAPSLNEAALRGTSMAELARAYALESRDGRPLAELLEGTWIGSVEHTKNGFDRLAEVEAALGRLHLPAFSIAVSRLKVSVEAVEVAVSVLNAVENVLHAEGRILSRRHVLVLGSRGAIGSALVVALRGRLASPARQLAGLDLRAAEPAARQARRDDPAQELAEGRSLADLPRAHWHATDLVLGVTGASVLTGAELEDWLLHGTPVELYLASGSTKTVEFAGLMAWMDALLQTPSPAVGGVPVELAVRTVEDPRTGRYYAQRYRISGRHHSARWSKEVVFLAHLTPVNFLFYGVPTELIDEVLAQLLSVSLGLVRRASELELAPRLHAVDRDIDADGEPLLAPVSSRGSASPG